MEGPEMQLQRTGLKPKRVVTSRKQEDIQQYHQAESQTEGCEASSQVFHRAVENEWLNIVEEFATIQMEEETAHSWRVAAVGAPASPGYSPSVNWRNGDIQIGYLGQAALWREQCGIFAQSKNCGARETATAR
jgi:hypothetical protein